MGLPCFIFPEPAGRHWKHLLEINGLLVELNQELVASKREWEEQHRRVSQSRTMPYIVGSHGVEAHVEVTPVPEFNIPIAARLPNGPLLMINVLAGASENEARLFWDIYSILLSLNAIVSAVGRPTVRVFRSNRSKNHLVDSIAELCSKECYDLQVSNAMTTEITRGTLSLGASDCVPLGIAFGNTFDNSFVATESWVSVDRPKFRIPFLSRKEWRTVTKVEDALRQIGCILCIPVVHPEN